MHIAAPRPETWLRPTQAGLYCEPGDFYVDPVRPVDRAVVTHGHADHARPGHRRVLATPETVAIMRQRYGDEAGGSFQEIRYAETVTISTVSVKLWP
ncbi:MAG TPA: DNA ligase-associated DEXH box helicase, partial [Stellaceae bacterium]|nr:DNA ligase-associated DEXH box helicase [Stellaceae bacterium]